MELPVLKLKSESSSLIVESLYSSTIIRPKKLILRIKAPILTPEDRYHHRPPGSSLWCIFGKVLIPELWHLDAVTLQRSLRKHRDTTSPAGYIC